MAARFGGDGTGVYDLLDSDLASCFKHVDMAPNINRDRQTWHFAALWDLQRCQMDDAGWACFGNQAFDLGRVCDIAVPEIDQRWIAVWAQIETQRSQAGVAVADIGGDDLNSTFDHPSDDP